MNLEGTRRAWLGLSTFNGGQQRQYQGLERDEAYCGFEHAEQARQQSLLLWSKWYNLLRDSPDGALR
ncbi:MAG: hypothetical protein ACRC56_12140, partial [Bosea sp. (in: a-proteobacteria)]